MTRFKAAGIGALAIVLAAAPVSSAFGNGGGRHYHGGYYVNPFYPIFGLAAAVVGTAAAIVTLPFALIGAAARAPYYPAGAYSGAPVADGYAPAPGYGQPAYAQPGYATPPAYYNSAPAPYYAAPQAYAPARPAYRAAYRAPGSYAPSAGYAPQYGSQYAPPPNNGYAPPPPNYPAPPSNYGQGNYRYNANPNGYAPRPVSYGPPTGSAPDYRPNN